MITPVCVIHGGAGTILRTQISAAQEAAYRSALDAILRSAQQCLSAGGSALDTVELAVSLLEDCELFNAGKGSVYTAAGTHEMDAAIMDGRQLAAGAVAGVSRLRNPVRAARLVMEKVRMFYSPAQVQKHLPVSMVRKLRSLLIFIPISVISSGSRQDSKTR
jgi:beta-aspartyl-peptidase (threonine type)